MVPASVAVVGSFNVDHVWRCPALPRPGETLAGAYASGPGGKGFNQAVAAARAGAATRFVCALGEDAGAVLARALAAADAIALHAQRSDAPTGTAGIFVDAQGRNSIVVGAGANAALAPEFVRAARPGDAAVVLAQLESPGAAVAAALQAARDAGALAILNPAPANVPVAAALLALADLLTPNETEFAALLAAHAGASVDAATVATLDVAALHGLSRRLFPHGTLLLTLGAAGLFVSHPDSARRGDAAACYRVPAEAVRALDTTGAGDACNGALAASLALAPAAPFATHAAFANRYAALSTERAGAAVAMPSRDELVARFRT